MGAPGEIVDGRATERRGRERATRGGFGAVATEYPLSLIAGRHCEYEAAISPTRGLLGI
jgi:hypothetical protein